MNFSKYINYSTATLSSKRSMARLQLSAYRGNNRVQNQISSMIYNSSEKKAKTREKDEEEKEENEVLIFAYPNPTKDKIYIEVKNNFDDGFKALLFDSQGKKVFESFLPNPNSIIDIGKFNSGIYQLIINRDFYPIYQQKIIKQ